MTDREAAPRPNPRGLRGFSLIEVLVSLVVVSVGALSAVSMQLIAKQNGRDAAQRLEATHLAYSLLERLRVNSSPEALQAYVSAGSPNLGRGLYRERLGLSLGQAPSPACLAESSCTGPQLASFDLWLWEQLLDGVNEQAVLGDRIVYAGGLDRPTACIASIAGGTAGVYTVTIAFRGSAALPVDRGVGCGLGASYASADGATERLYGEQDEYRRTLTVQAYIAPVARE
jgi:type IV pilus assembly protein PilV